MAERGAPVRNGDGVSCAVDRRRIKSAGNAVVPQIPELIGRAILQAEAAQ
jgi:DNA (cytosine-5)-methyltransferase 1